MDGVLSEVSAAPVARPRFSLAPPSAGQDRAFETLTLLASLAVVGLLFLVGWELIRESNLSIKKFGFHFLTTSTWDPVAEQYGALPFIYGTFMS
jgi:phosphate transport system permease protein